MEHPDQPNMEFVQTVETNGRDTYIQTVTDGVEQETIHVDGVTYQVMPQANYCGRVGEFDVRPQEVEGIRVPQPTNDAYASAFSYEGTTPIDGIECHHWQINFDDTAAANSGELSVYAGVDSGYLVKIDGWFSEFPTREGNLSYDYTETRSQFDESFSIQPPDC
ncbi:MAG: hypothetical protein U5K37_09895 [Natrialbaceae archaeon]|nr:hypothetical protein [Natrialbaceae archaeon]